jgi:uncharacterized protein YycO
MSNSGNSIKNEAIREMPASGVGAITTSYQALGGVFTRDVFRTWMTNNTNGDIYVSTDGVTDMMKFATTSGRAFDDKTNDMFRKKGTQFYIRFDVAPGAPAGWFALEAEYV